MVAWDKLFLKTPRSLELTRSGVDQDHSFPQDVVGDVEGQRGRLSGPNEPTRRPVPLDGGDGHHPERPVLERPDLQPHALGDDPAGHETWEENDFRL